jgi:transcriptional regulator with XRE-family HTH domain
MSRTTYEQIEADPRQRPGLRREELILAVTNAISEEMDRQDMTKAELAERLGRTRGEVTQLLSGGRNLTLATIAELADAIGCRVHVELRPSGRPAVRAPRRSAQPAARRVRTAARQRA